MVGLFWIEAEEVFLGVPPVAPIPGVLLSPTGLQITGADPQSWPWSTVMDVEVTEVPVRSAVTRWATRAATVAAAVLDFWVPGSPPEMTVTVSTMQGEHHHTPVLSGAATAYTQREVDLSHALLAHFVRGSASPGALTAWWKETQPVEVLRSRQREAVLEHWLAKA
ncbi:hypothetical protein [Streptomyces sp. NPDC094147]